VVASAKGSLACSYRWFSVPVFLWMLVGCGSDFPPNTGGRTIRGVMKNQCNKLNNLIDPYVTVMATDKLRDAEGNIVPSYISLNSLPARPFPEAGIPYELKGLYPGYDYIVYAAITDIGVKDWTATVCVGGYPDIFQLILQTIPDSAKIRVTNTAATTGIDFTLYDF
jgi:hypothetical protein